MKAAILEVGPTGRVTIEHENGTPYRNLDPRIFSPEDQRYIQDWIEKQQKALDNADLQPDSRIVVRVFRGRNNKPNAYGDVDDREVMYQPRVQIQNDELEKSFKGIQGTVVYIGQSVFDRQHYKILNRQTFTIDAPKQSQVEWEGNPFQNHYDDNPDNGHAFGHKYAGYLLVLKNRAGETVHVTASKSYWNQSPGSVLKADTSSNYDREFSRKIASASGQ